MYSVSRDVVNIHSYLLLKGLEIGTPFGRLIFAHLTKNFT